MIRAAAALAAVLATAATAWAAAPPPVPHLGRVVVVVFENKETGDVVGNPDAPTFAKLARQGAVLTGYHGVAHPSLPNYLALVSGSTQGITSDCEECSVSGRNLADTLAAAHRTWKTYAEGYASGSDYAKKHNPFLYFDDVASSPSRLARIVDYSRFASDLAAKRLPDFSLVVPNLCHDMHDCSVADGDRWLASFLPPVLRSPQLKGGVVFVVFDEGTSSIGGGGNVAAYAVGPAVRPGSRSTGTTSHYGLLRTIEDAWRLPRLGLSAHMPPIRGIWRVPRKG